MPTMELTNREAAIIERIRMTPEQRLAEANERRTAYMSHLPVEQKAEIERRQSLTLDERRREDLLKEQDRISSQLSILQVNLGDDVKVVKG